MLFIYFLPGEGQYIKIYDHTENSLLCHLKVFCKVSVHGIKILLYPAVAAAATTADVKHEGECFHRMLLAILL